mmetsp:Transcript_12724/g.22977  ORF Transcript_12724/g.22977 Transcript_12724/m.22977 type:complete len:835 (+) Transcript_12724:824-3328(+)
MMVDRLMKHILGDNIDHCDLAEFVQSRLAAPVDHMSDELDNVHVWFDKNIVRNDGTWPRETHQTQSELVDRCVSAVVKKKYETDFMQKDILSLGYYKTSFDEKSLCDSSLLGGIQCRCPNTSVNFLKRPCWEQLLDVVGEKLMSYMIMNTVLMYSVGKSWVQLTGLMLNTELCRVGTDILMSNALGCRTIKRGRIFYHMGDGAVGLGRKHALNQKVMSGRRLLKIIFGAVRRGGVGFSQIRKRRIWCMQLIKRHQRCPYRNLFEKHCPLPEDVPHVLELATSKVQVSNYLKQVCLRVLPRSTFPNNVSRRHFLQMVHAFVFLNRNENMTVEEIESHVNSADVSEVPLEWIFSSLLVELIRNMFYCTEANGSGREVFYFHKTVWSKRCEAQLDRLCENGMLVRVPGPKSVKETGKLRFVPKSSGGLRPIMNCKRMNSKLIYIYHALKAAFRDPVRCKTNQCTQILGIHEFYAAYLAFVRKTKMKKQKKYYIVSLDVDKCFDNINLAKLNQAVEAVLHQDQYTIEGHSMVVLNEAIQRARGVTQRCVSLDSQQDSEETNRPVDIFDRASRQRKQNGIFIDRCECVTLSKQAIMKGLGQHVAGNFTTFGSAVFRQAKGIPQGSILSSLLSTLYYESFEKKHVYELLFATDPDDTFCIRMLDDYLVISPDKEKVVKFSTAMRNGFADFGVYVNPEKTCVSWGGDVESPVPWCGFCINPADLSVTFDLERLRKQQKVRSFARRRMGQQEQERQALQFLETRCSPVLFDKRMNSHAAVENNLRTIITTAVSLVDKQYWPTFRGTFLEHLFQLIQMRTKGASKLKRAYIERTLVHILESFL